MQGRSGTTFAENSCTTVDRTTSDHDNIHHQLLRSCRLLPIISRHKWLHIITFITVRNGSAVCILLFLLPVMRMHHIMTILRIITLSGNGTLQVEQDSPFPFHWKSPLESLLYILLMLYYHSISYQLLIGFFGSNATCCQPVSPRGRRKWKREFPNTIMGVVEYRIPFQIRVSEYGRKLLNTSVTEHSGSPILQ